MRVPYSYLHHQFGEIGAYLEDIAAVARAGDFTLGAQVREFEGHFSQLTGLSHAIGVANGTDALVLSLKALGVGPGDEVVTVPNTFVATVGAIVQVGAQPVFVDVGADYNMDPSLLGEALTARTKAVLPVHLTGNPADMPAIMEFAHKHSLVVVEDAAQAVCASIGGQHVGSFGDAAGFSLHPLKNLNVWGDGGVVATRSPEVAAQVRLLRNHGLASRDEVAIWGFNSRLDSVQAAVANRVMGGVEAVTQARIDNASRLDAQLARLGQYVTIPPRKPDVRQVYHTYMIQVQARDRLLAHLLSKGIEAKVHYPIPLHLQPAAAHLGYGLGAFPVAEGMCLTILTLPIHQYLTTDQLDYMAEEIDAFYTVLPSVGLSPQCRRVA